MKHVRKRCLTAFRSQDVLNDQVERSLKLKPICFRWKDHLLFEDYHKNIPVSLRVNADFEGINQP